MLVQQQRLTGGEGCHRLTHPGEPDVGRSETRPSRAMDGHLAARFYLDLVTLGVAMLLVSFVVAPET